MLLIQWVFQGHDDNHTTGLPTFNIVWFYYRVKVLQVGTKWHKIFEQCNLAPWEETAFYSFTKDTITMEMTSVWKYYRRVIIGVEACTL